MKSNFVQTLPSIYSWWYIKTVCYSNLESLLISLFPLNGVSELSKGCLEQGCIIGKPYVNCFSDQILFPIMHNVCLFAGLMCPRFFSPEAGLVLCSQKEKRHLDSQKASNRCCINDDSSIRLTNDLATDIYRGERSKEVSSAAGAP